MTLVSPEAKDYDFRSLDYLMTGGAMVTPAIKSSLLKLPNVKDVINVSNGFCLSTPAPWMTRKY